MREGPEQEVLAYVFILLLHAYLGVATPQNGSECFEGGKHIFEQVGKFKYNIII